MALKKKEREGVVRRYTFKLNPTKKQADRLHEIRLMMGELWNALLEQREMAHRFYDFHRSGKTLNFFDQSKEITKLRAEMPEFASLSSPGANAVANKLDLAFKAFFSRVKKGFGGGFPSYKHKGTMTSIPNGAIGSGWNFYPTGGTTINYRKGGDYTSWHRTKSWRFYLKGVEGLIKARGEFPSPILKALDSVVIWQGREWWLSIAVEVMPHITIGERETILKLDLIDSFVENGGSAPGSSGQPEDQISPTLQGDNGLSGSDPLGMGAEQRWHAPPHFKPEGSDTLETGADQRSKQHSLDQGCGSDTPESTTTRWNDQDLARSQFKSVERNERIDQLKSERDLRFKKGSWKYREYSRRIARLHAKDQRGRKEAAHKWTTNVARASKEVVLILPDIQDITKTGKGSQFDPGAAVKTVAKVNRHILRQIPATIEAMLKYKMEEGGGTFRSVKDELPKAAIGQEVSKTKKLVKKARKKVDLPPVPTSR